MKGCIQVIFTAGFTVVIVCIWKATWWQTLTFQERMDFIIGKSMYLPFWLLVMTVSILWFKIAVLKVPGQFQFRDDTDKPNRIGGMGRR